jgi:hypothetical protein
MKEAWHNPYVVGLVGLALMIAGWKLGSIPPDRLSTVRELVEKGELPEKPTEIAVPQGPPYRLVGRLTFYAGLLLFVVAAVQMWSQPVPPKEEDTEGKTEPEAHREESEEAQGKRE